MNTKNILIILALILVATGIYYVSPFAYTIIGAWCIGLVLGDKFPIFK